MRALPPLLAAAALCLGGCTATAVGAVDPVTTGSSTPADAEAPAPAGTLPAAAAASPSPRATVGSAGETIPASPVPSPGMSGMLAASPVASGPPLPPNPFELGGPAPVGSFVLGDSIALGVAPQLSRLGYPVVGIVGRSASESYLREYLMTPLAQQSPAWVIVLGTNHRGDPADVARLEGLVDLIDSLRTAGARQRVYWVTPHRDPRYAGGMSGWSLDSFGAELGRLADERRWLEIIDFAATARLHPEWYDADAGRLHPDSRGQGVLAALIAGPDAVPVEIPAPLFSGAPTPSPAPEPTTFVNSPRQPSPTPSPSSTTTPAPSPMDPVTESSSPVPLAPTEPQAPIASPAAESPVAATPS